MEPQPVYRIAAPQRRADSRPHPIRIVADSRPGNWPLGRSWIWSGARRVGMERLTTRGPPDHPHQVTVSPSPWVSLRAGPGAGVHSEKPDSVKIKVILASGEGLAPRAGVSAQAGAKGRRQRVRESVRGNGEWGRGWMDERHP